MRADAAPFDGNQITQLPPLQLKQPDLAHGTLFGQLGLDLLDLGSLDEAESIELKSALKDTGLSLGDRVKLRMWMSATSNRKSSSIASESPIRVRLQTSEEGTRKNSGLSAECAKNSISRIAASVPWSNVALRSTVALMVTALLGIGSFVLQVCLKFCYRSNITKLVTCRPWYFRCCLQARVAKAADLNQKEIETAVRTLQHNYYVVLCHGIAYIGL
jgi:hypothetical protein